jgi:hypothetical protein
MSENHFDRLSAEQRNNARSALVGAFGRAPIDAITPIAGGASSASTFRVDRGGRCYLLRLASLRESAALFRPPPIRPASPRVSIWLASASKY